MRTDKQNEASRRNGAKSKGPVTEEGKAKSSLNGITHGLSGSHRFLYSNERDDLYQELLNHYMTVFAPANGVEADLVHQIVTASWRMKRIDNIEVAVVDVQMEKQSKWVDKNYKDIDSETRQGLAFQTQTVGDTVALDGRYHARALRSYNTAYKILRELQRDRFKREAQATTASMHAVTKRTQESRNPRRLTLFIYEPVPSQVPADIVIAAIPLHRESNSRMLR